MEYKILNEINQLSEIDIQSNSKIQIIYKHSTQCSVSYFANKNLLKEMKDINSNTSDIYYLDLITYRNISNAISTRYGIRHESPQLLIIKDGKCIYDASHSDVLLKIALHEINDV